MSKRARFDDDGNSVATAAASGGSAMLATADVYPGIMPIPKSICIQSPDYYTIKLKYVTWTSGDHTLGVSQVKQYRINSLYDPEYTGVGHQPLGRDRMAGIFKYYRVLKTDFTVDVFANEAAADSCYTVADLMSTTPTDIGNIADITGEMKYGRVRFLGPRGNSQDHVQFSRTFFPGKIDQTIDTSADEGAGLATGIWTPVGSNPTEEQYYTIQTTPIAGAAPTTYGRVVIGVRIMYTVQFRETSTTTDSTMD